MTYLLSLFQFTIYVWGKFCGIKILAFGARRQVT